MRLLLFALALFCAIFSLCGTASAVVLDWSALSWPAGSLSNSYDVDPSSPGNDVTVTIGGDTGRLQPSLASPFPQTPAITRAFDGGLGTSPKTLELALDLSNNSQFVTVTINFSAQYAVGVSNVSLQLFDIDTNNSGGSTYQDVIRSISATSTTGSLIAPTITGLGSNVSLSGTGLTQTLKGTASTVDLGAGSDAGNATISFNASGIRSITFTYGSGTMFADPTYQHIGIYNITYEVVPESSSLAACAAIALFAIWFSRRPAKTLSRRS